MLRGKNCCPKKRGGALHSARRLSAQRSWKRKIAGVMDDAVCERGLSGPTQCVLSARNYVTVTLALVWCIRLSTGI